MSLKKLMPVWSERTENTVVQHCLQYRQDQAIKKIYVLLLYVLVKVLFQVLHTTCSTRGVVKIIYEAKCFVSIMTTPRMQYILHSIRTE